MTCTNSIVERPVARPLGHGWTLLLGLLLLMLPLSGCAWFRGDGYTDADATWGTKYRAAPTSKRTTEPYFLDEKSQQIERSLGL